MCKIREKYGYVSLRNCNNMKSKTFYWVSLTLYCTFLFANFVYRFTLYEKVFLSNVLCQHIFIQDAFNFVWIYRKAIKAVGVLFGFLGFSNFIFFINPKDGGYWEDAYYIINAILQSSQVNKYTKSSNSWSTYS